MPGHIRCIRDDGPEGVDHGRAAVLRADRAQLWSSDGDLLEHGWRRDQLRNDQKRYGRSLGAFQQSQSDLQADMIVSDC